MNIYDEQQMEECIGSYMGSILSSTKARDHEYTLSQVWIQFGNIQKQVEELNPGEIKCAKSCSFCCHLSVSVNAHEIFPIIRYIRANLPSSKISSILRVANQNYELTKDMSYEEGKRVNTKCPLLSSKGECLCYVVRPSVCRYYHSKNISLCKQFFDDPTLILEEDCIEDLMIGFGFTFGALGKAYERCGYDGTPYTLNHALMEGLKKKKPSNQWRAKEPAFSKIASSQD